jgi:hypothetical protein
MELIKEIEKQKIGKYIYRIGVFKCPICGRNKTMRYHIGLRDFTCGNHRGWNAITHGETRKSKPRSKLYVMWVSMKMRCKNKNDANYKNYGGRGIKLFEGWIDFKVFKNWAIDNGYKNGLTIDRIDNNGNYSPENCQFISLSANSVKRRGIKLTYEKAEEIREYYKNNKVNYIQLAEVFNISSSHARDIILRKRWPRDYK